MATATITLKTDTTDNWESSGRILALNEPAFERTTDGYINFKLGDGKTAWASLPYVWKLKTIEEINADVDEKYNLILDKSSSFAEELTVLKGEVTTAVSNAETATTRANTAAEAAEDVVAEKVGIDDTTAGSATTYSSNKINTLLDNASDKIDLLTNIIASEHSDSWSSVSKLTSAGLASAAFAIGEQLAEDWNDVRSSGATAYADVPMNVAHFSDSEVMQTDTDDDGNVVTADTKGMFLQWHYTTPFDMPFDAREAMYDVPEGGLAAGTYYFKLVCTTSSWKAYACNGKYYSFTLAEDLTEGEQLYLVGNQDTTDFAGTNVQVFTSPTSFTAATSMALTEVTEDTAEGTYLGATDGTGDVNHFQRMFLGYNRYKNSAVRQWLNSSAGVGAWWTKQNKWDRAPSQLNTYAGFLAGYSDDFVSAMKPIKIQVAANTVTDGGVTDVMYDKVFLPSLEQMYVNPQVSGIEGEAWDYYKQLAAANGRTGKYAQYGTYAELKSYSISAKTTACYVRLRSALRGHADNAWTVSTSGYVSSYGASVGLRARPACFI